MSFAFYPYLADTFSDCIDERTTANCPDEVRYSPFRTVNGICNNLMNPTWGAAQTRLRRIARKCAFYSFLTHFTMLKFSLRGTLAG